MTAEFNAIRRLLSSGQKTANKNPTWTRIHEETCCGTLVGRAFQFSDDELQRLRQHAQSLTGLDPLFDSTAGGRMEMAEKVPDEKLASDSVFGRLVVIATAGKAQVKVVGESVRVPRGAILSTPLDQLDVHHLHQQRLVIIENGALMPECHHIRLPKGWEDCVFVYRGHRENIRHTQQLIQRHPAELLGLFFDFDPAGLDMALAVGKGNVLIPEERTKLISAFGASINNRSAFRRQGREMNRLRDRVADTHWEQIVSWLETHEIAIMQEHLVRRELPLVTLCSAT